MSTDARVSTDVPDVCPRLPSSNSAYDLVTGVQGAWMNVGRDILARSALVGLGMFIVGERNHLVRNALAGGVTIEAFVIAYIYWTTQRQQPALQPAQAEVIAPTGEVVVLVPRSPYRWA